MTPEERQLLIDTARRLNDFLDVYYREHFIDKIVFDRDVYMNRTMYISSLSLTDNLTLSEGINIATGTATGSKIATTSGQKLGFWGATPVTRPASISDASGGATVDSEARSAINSLLSTMRSIGIIAP
jgi:hypothetical protein